MPKGLAVMKSHSAVKTKVVVPLARAVTTVFGRMMNLPNKLSALLALTTTDCR